MASQDRSSCSESTVGETALVAAAITGDRVALERLLLAHYDGLARQVAARLPARLQSTQAVEDILQLTFCQAFRDVGRFEQRDDATFANWLAQIAENRLLDAIKQHDAQKRGGGVPHLTDETRDESRAVSLWNWVASQDPSPSSIVARDEALHALNVALASLPSDQREAIRLRLLEGKSLEEAAAALGRTPDAVRGLVHRGKVQLQAAMGRASQWIKTK
jgi:RNA polymerase sigma-70 factor, ECF subfamily